MPSSRDISVRYLVDVVDRGTQHLLAEDRKVRKSAAETSRALDGSSKSAARSSGRVASSSRVTATRVSRDHERMRHSWAETARRFAIGASVITVAYKAVAEAKEAVTQTEDLAKTTLALHKSLGLSAKTASEFGAVLKVRGVESKQVAQAFGILAKNADAAAKGGASQAETFKTLGISMKELRGASAEQLIGEIAEGMKTLGPGTERTAASMKLFGRGWQSIVPILRDGKGALQDQLNLADKYGATFSGGSLRSMQKFIAAQREAKLATLGLQVAFGTKLAPILTDVVKGVARFVAQIRSGKGAGGQFARTVSSIATVLYKIGKTAVSVGKFLVGAFKLTPFFLAGKLIVKFGQAFSGVFTGIEKVFGNVMAFILRGFAKLFDLASHLPFVGKKFAGLADAARNAAAKVDTLGEKGRAAHTPLENLRQDAENNRKAWGRLDSRIGSLRANLDKLPKEKRIRLTLETIGKATKLTGQEIANLLNLNPAGRRGGVFYQDGGTVPVRVSPGELLVSPDGGAAMVPGPRTMADSVLAGVRSGTMVFTGHGQRMLAGGATLGEALAGQLPHFAAGGEVARATATAGALRSAGFRGRRLVLQVATAGRESRWRDIRGGPNDNGTYDWGRNQINDTWANDRVIRPLWPRRLRNEQNARMAYRVDRVQGLSAWRLPSLAGDSTVAPFMATAQTAVAHAHAGAGGGGGSRPGKSRLSFAGRLPTPVAAFESGFQAGMEGTRLWDTDPVASIVSAATARLERQTRRSAPRPARTGRLRGSAIPHSGAWAGTEALVRWALRGFQVSNWKRTPQQNAAAGGAPNSDHLTTVRNAFAGDAGPPSDSTAATIAGRLGLRGWGAGSYARYGVRGLPSFGAQLLWKVKDHYDHVHLGVRRGRFRGGGTVGTFSRPGSPGALVGQARGLASMPVGAKVHDALKQLADTLDDAGQVAYRTLERTRERIAGEIKRLSKGRESRQERVAVRRLQAADRLVATEMGRRNGLIVAQMDRQADRLERRRNQLSRLFRVYNVDEASAGALNALAGLQKTQNDQLAKTRDRLGKALARARRIGDRGAVQELVSRVEQINEDIAEGIAAQVEQQRQAVMAAAQEAIDTSAFQTGAVQARLQGLELSQQLAGTFDTGGAQRADFIHQQIVPALQAELNSILGELSAAASTGDAATYRQAILDALGKQNEISQANLDANEATAANTDDLKDLAGSTTFEFGSQRFTDLVAVGTGA